MTKVLAVIVGLLVIGLIVGGVLVLHGNDGKVSASPSPTPAKGLQITDTVKGTGAEAKVGSTITVKYTGKLADGTVFDSTDKQGGNPATFTLAQGQLIDGWVQGIPGMKVGGKRTLVIPPDLAYGAQGNGSVPPNATLTFDIELIDVK